MAHTNEEILLSSVCDRVRAFCNKLNKRLDKLDEQQHVHHQYELTQPVQGFHPYLPAQPHSFRSADQPWQQPPDPPDWQRNTQLQPYGSHDFVATQPRQPTSWDLPEQRQHQSHPSFNRLPPRPPTCWDPPWYRVQQGHQFYDQQSPSDWPSACWDTPGQHTPEEYSAYDQWDAADSRCLSPLHLHHLPSTRSPPTAAAIPPPPASISLSCSPDFRYDSKELIADDKDDSMESCPNTTIDRLSNRDQVGAEEVLLDVEEKDGFLQTFEVANFEYVDEAERAVDEEIPAPPSEGPGCSSLAFVLAEEIGPVHIEKYSQPASPVVPPPTPQRSPSCWSSTSPTSHCRSAAQLPAAAAAPSLNLPPPAPPCSPDIIGVEEALLDDEEKVGSFANLRFARVRGEKCSSRDKVEQNELLRAHCFTFGILEELVNHSSPIGGIGSSNEDISFCSTLNLIQSESMVMEKLKIGRAWSEALDVELDVGIVAMFRQDLVDRSGCACLKLISAGKSIDHNDNSTEEEFLAEEECNDGLSRLRTVTITWATIHADGSLPVQDINLELANQNGHKVHRRSETGQLAMMTGLCANGTDLMKREKYRDALVVFNMGNVLLCLYNLKLLSMVDHVLIFQINMVWCYLRLRDISWLSVAGIRLERAREGVKRTHEKEILEQLTYGLTHLNKAMNVKNLNQLVTNGAAFIPRRHSCPFDPGGDTSPRFSLSTLFVALWFPP